MGLDAVELVMSIEGQFRITLPSDGTARIATVGDLCNLIVIELERQRGEVVDRFSVYSRLEPMLVEILAVPASDIAWDAKLVEDLGMG